MIMMHVRLLCDTPGWCVKHRCGERCIVVDWHPYHTDALRLASFRWSAGCRDRWMLILKHTIARHRASRATFSGSGGPLADQAAAAVAAATVAMTRVQLAGKSFSQKMWS